MDDLNKPPQLTKAQLKRRLREKLANKQLERVSANARKQQIEKIEKLLLDNTISKREKIILSQKLDKLIELEDKDDENLYNSLTNCDFVDYSDKQ